jgi:hypothetical protein
LGDLTIRWTGDDETEVSVTDEFDVEREVDRGVGSPTEETASAKSDVQGEQPRNEQEEPNDD